MNKIAVATAILFTPVNSSWYDMRSWAKSNQDELLEALREYGYGLSILAIRGKLAMSEISNTDDPTHIDNGYDFITEIVDQAKKKTKYNDLNDTEKLAVHIIPNGKD